MNYLKTGLLLAGLTALFMAVGYMIAGEGGMVNALVIAMVMNFITYWFSDKIVLSMYGAKEIGGEIKQMVSELARDAGIPEPRVYMIETNQPNAFATGRSPSHAAVAVTRGIVDILDERELRGVLAHELSHIKNRDTLIMTITATIAGALSMLAQFFMFFGGRRDGNGINPIAGLVLVILAPIIAMLVQMAISRTREYAADHTGAHISKDPLALASALQKLENAAKKIPNMLAERSPGTAHLFIVNPLHMRKSDNLFATHPRMYNRIKALENIASQMGSGGSQNMTRNYDATPSDKDSFGRKSSNNPGPWG